MRFGEMTRGIVWMHDDNAASARRDALLQSVEINLPAVIVVEWVAHKLHVLNIGEKCEERVAGLGDQDFIAGVAERAEDVGVGLAGAGGEDDAVDRHFPAARSVVSGDRLPRSRQSTRVRIVCETGRACKSLQDGAIVVLESAFCGIRNREIEQGLRRRAM